MLKRQSTIYQKEKTDLMNQIDQSRSELTRRQMQWDEERKAFELEKDRLNNEIRLGVTQKENVEKERDHF